MLITWLTDTVTSDLDRAIHYTLLWGVEGLELRSVGSVEERVPHVNEEKLIRRIQEHDLPVAAVVPGLFQGRVADRAAWLNELVSLEELLQFCQRIGCHRVVTSAFSEARVSELEQSADAMRRAGQAAEEYGITLAVLNEPDMARSTGQAVAALLEAVDHPAVQAAWHPASALQAGEDPRAGLQALEGRIALVRCADGFMRGGDWQEKRPGQGAVGWADQLEMLQRQGFDGPVSLEVNAEPRSKQGLRAAHWLIRQRRTLASVERPNRNGG